MNIREYINRLETLAKEHGEDISVVGVRQSGDDIALDLDPIPNIVNLHKDGGYEWPWHNDNKPEDKGRLAVELNGAF